MAVLLLFLGARFVIMVQPRAMEFDQICTLLTAEARTWHAYIAAVPADSQPPFSHIAARFGLMLPLPESIGVHLVSALVTGLAAVCLFRLFARRGAPLAGLCSAAWFAASRSVEFMFTVRPYAALIAGAVLALLVYDTYRRRRAAMQRASLWPLAWTIVLSATIHALSLVYVLLPILAGELLYLRQTRRVDTRLLLAVVLAATAFGFDFTLARQIQTHYMSLVPMSARTPGLPTFAKLREVLTIPVERHWQVLLLGMVIVATVVLWRRQRTHSRLDAVVENDLTFPLIAAGSTYVAAILAFCMGLVNHYFFTRYASPVFLCAPLLIGTALSAVTWRQFPWLSLATAAALLVLPLSAFRAALQERVHRSPREDYAVIFQHGTIVASPLTFPTLWWYATPQERSRMQIVSDSNRYRTLPDGIPEVVLQRFAAGGVLPFPLTHYRDFHPGTSVFLVKPILSGDTWLPAALQEEGYRCAPAPDVHLQDYAMDRCSRTVLK